VTAPVTNSRTVLARAEVFRAIGSFDEDMDMGEDLDWLMRARDAGVRYELLPEVVLHQRLHSSNVSYRLHDSIAMRLRIARDSVARKARPPEPSVSVVLPVLDGERFLREAIASAHAQTHRPLEVIVVDDGSSDRSADVAEGMGARVLRRAHRGVSAARNAGIETARGDLIALLDADDRWPPNRLHLQIDRLRRRPELGFVLGRARLFLSPGTARPAWLTDDLARGEPAVARGTLLARRELFDRIGGFDESSDICEDLDWMVRARDARIPYEVLEDVLVEYRVHDANTGLSRRGDLERGVLRTLRSSIDRKRAEAGSR
jgi:glycosyltransferase involved in cell wall biosynthesis